MSNLYNIDKNDYIQLVPTISYLKNTSDLTNYSDQVNNFKVGVQHQVADLSELHSIFNDAQYLAFGVLFCRNVCYGLPLTKWTDFQDGRLHYQMSKNGEHGSVKVPAKALAILEQYRHHAGASKNRHNLELSFLQDTPSLGERFEVLRRIVHSVKAAKQGNEQNHGDDRQHEKCITG